MHRSVDVLVRACGSSQLHCSSTQFRSPRIETSLDFSLTPIVAPWTWPGPPQQDRNRLHHRRQKEKENRCVIITTRTGHCNCSCLRQGEGPHATRVDLIFPLWACSMSRLPSLPALPPTSILCGPFSELILSTNESSPRHPTR